MIPFRNVGMPGQQWQEYMHLTANRLRHYITHLRSIGGIGVLLYTDSLRAQGIAPYVQDLIQDGSVVFVSWSAYEQKSYPYDQTLVYSHVFLGLATCGTNLWISATDIDELLSGVDGRSRWPEMLACLRQLPGHENVSMMKLYRVDVLVSGREAEERELWSSSSPTTKGVGYPLDLYDQVANKPYGNDEGKIIVCPAYRVVSVWVHQAWPLQGSELYGGERCAMFLHLTNYWVLRRKYDPKSWHALSKTFPVIRV